MTFNGQKVSQFGKNVVWAVVIGSGGSLLVNTARRDSERAKRLLGYAAITGLGGASLAFTYGIIRNQRPVLLSLSAGPAVFAISGVFYVIRDNLLVSSSAHRWRRKLDQLTGNFTLTTRQQAMTDTHASAISGAATGFLMGSALGSGFSVAISTSLQGALLAVVGQWTTNKCHKWILEESIKHHYPELVANAKECEEHWIDRGHRFVTTRTHSSIVDEKLQTCEMQLAILQEEEERLLRLKAEQEKGR